MGYYNDVLHASILSHHANLHLIMFNRETHILVLHINIKELFTIINDKFNEIYQNTISGTDILKNIQYFIPRKI